LSANKETYSVDVTCWNCGYDGPVQVPKGRKFNPWGWGEIDACPNCGCDDLHMKPKIKSNLIFGFGGRHY